jgi:hypothetical protein
LLRKNQPHLIEKSDANIAGRPASQQFIKQEYLAIIIMWLADNNSDQPSSQILTSKKKE